MQNLGDLGANGGRGSKFQVENVIFGIADPDLPIHYNDYMQLGLQWRLRVVYSWAPPLLSVFGRKTPVLGQNLTVWGGISRGLTLNLTFITPKRHVLSWFHVLWAIARNNPSTGLTCARVLEKRYKLKRHKNVIFHPFLQKLPVERFVPNLV